MGNPARKMIRRLILQLIASMLLTVVFLSFFDRIYDAVIRMAYRYPSLRLFQIVNSLGGVRIIVPLMAGALVIVFMCLFNLPRYLYYGKILRSVERVSSGDVRETIPVQQNNELTDLARGINGLVRRMHASLEEERRAEQTKNELITNMSHDLRTPLTSLMGYLELVDQDRYRDEVELRHYVAIANEKAVRLNELIRDLFDYTRMQNRQLPSERHPIDLAELAGQLLTEYRLSLLEQGMEGRMSRPAGMLQVLGDARQLTRVFENLLSNAMHYGKSGKFIDMTVRREGQTAVAEIINYGDPIPSVDLPYVFDRFYRVEKSRSEHTGGSGLGLAIAKGIIEGHGGSIEAQSDEGRTVFRFRLPLLDNQQLKKS
ncbi:HAMP domain-containing sensor histidine kinase [Gorillibacterium sp. CAU 1737]|uniref:sensor histidine kinase n=1 Tax=Gorillibacterium sp. CAU 1737 TaxID=3140362 RepID=UPI0032604F0E